MTAVAQVVRRSAHEAKEAVQDRSVLWNVDHMAEGFALAAKLVRQCAPRPVQGDPKLRVAEGHGLTGGCNQVTAVGDELHQRHCQNHVTRQLGAGQPHQAVHPTRAPPSDGLSGGRPEVGHGIVASESCRDAVERAPAGSGREHLKPADDVVYQGADVVLGARRGRTQLVGAGGELMPISPARTSAARAAGQYWP
jgi:hypothetical protein